MRAQLSRPENTVLGPDAYNQFFTMHGLTMMFLFAVPIMEAMGLYFVPLMIGARNVAFPRLNAYGYWVYLCGGIFLYYVFHEHRPRCGLVRVRTSVRAGVQPGQAGRCVCPGDHLHRDRGAGRIGRADRHHLQEPGAGHDAQPDAALRLGHAGAGLHDPVRDALGGHRDAVLGDGPADRDPLLQPGGGWRRPPLAAPVLVLRPSRGLHHLHSRRWVSCRPSSPRSPAGRCSAIRSWCSR